MNTYYIELDFTGESKETGIAVSQGDYGRLKFSFAVKKDGGIITDAASADISFQLTNGYIVQGKLSGSAGLYDYIFQGNELQAPGKTIATVTLNYADGRTSSEAFSFEVRYNPLYSRLINAGSYIPELENIKAQAETYVEYLGGLIEQIKQEMGQTALTKESLVNNFDVSEPGLKALDAAAGRTLNLSKMDKANIINNGLTTEEGYAADARQLNPNIANTLAWQVAKTNSDLAYAEKHIIADCDTFLDATITALANGSTLHKPDSVYWYKVKNVAQNANSMTQLAFPVSTDSSVTIYYRHRQNAVWGTWNNFITNSDLFLKITTGSLKSKMASLSSGKYAGYYSAGATDTPSSWGTFEAIVIDATSASIVAVDTTSGKLYATYKNSSGWHDWTEK